MTMQIDGPIMAGYLPRCLRCGQTKLVRWEDVLAPVLTGSDPGSADTPDEQTARIQELAGACDCGGTFAMDASVRCGDCRSSDVDLADWGIAD